MNIQVNPQQSLANLPSSKPANNPAPQAAAAETTPAAKKDDLTLSVSLKSLGKGALGVGGGTVAGVLSGTAATAAITIIAEKGIPKHFGGYLAVGGLLVGGGAGLIGAGSSALFAGNAKTGAIVGGITGGVAAGAYLGKQLGSVGGAALGAAVGAIAGAVGGYTAAKIKE